MKRSTCYAAAAWALIVGGLGYAVFNGVYWNTQFYKLPYPRFDFGFFTSLLILVLSLLPGIQLLRIARGRSLSSKATHVSLILIILAILWGGTTAILHTLECDLKVCSEPWQSFGYYIFGYSPAAIVYAIALLLMLAGIILSKHARSGGRDIKE